MRFIRRSSRASCTAPPSPPIATPLIHIIFCQYAVDGTADAGVGRVQRGHLRRVRAPGQPRLVPRLPLLRRRILGRNALRLQTALPRTSLHEYCPETHAQEILLTLS